MPPTANIAALFSEGRYEEVLRGAAEYLPDAAANPRAAWLKAQAHYQLGEYFACAELVESALARCGADAPLDIRLQLACLLAKTLLQQGEYASALDLVRRTVPDDASPRDEYGEVLLAGAWAAYFAGDPAVALGFSSRVSECSTEHFTLGRAALVAALAARRGGEPRQGSAFLLTAQHHLGEARNAMGYPEPIRTLYLAQVDIARHGDLHRLDQAMEEASRLPQGARIARFVTKAVELYRRAVAKEQVTHEVLRAVAQGLKRQLVALLPGSQLVAPDLTGESSEAHVPAAAVLALREKVKTLRTRRPEDATLIRSRSAGSGTILHVEPDLAQANAFAECLKDSQFKVVARAADVNSALAQYVELRPKMVVLDLLSPGAILKGSEGAAAAVGRFLRVDPQAKIVVTYTLEQKYLFMGAIRAGARAHLQKAFEKPAVLGALHKASSSRSGLEALQVPTLELRRPIACTWKTMEGGLGSLLRPWQNLVARVIDPLGIETSLERPLPPRTVLRMNVELPGAKPFSTLAEVISCKPDTVPNRFAVRLSFIKFAPEAKAQLEAFITDALARSKTAGR